MSDFVQGQATAESAGSDFNALSFMAQQILALISTAKLVKVLSCTNEGGVAPVGFVDVQPLVNQIDGSGKATPHAPIYNLPYSRLQGGANAVIMDPQVGDIGVAVFADRDISSVKANKAQANPGSFRKYDMADGIYLGYVLNGAPTQYIQFNTDGITVVSPVAVTVNAPAVTTNCETAVVNASTSIAFETPTFTVN